MIVSWVLLYILLGLIVVGIAIWHDKMVAKVGMTVSEFLEVVFWSFFPVLNILLLAYGLKEVWKHSKFLKRKLF